MVVAVVGVPQAPLLRYRVLVGLLYMAAGVEVLVRVITLPVRQWLTRQRGALLTRQLPEEVAPLERQALHPQPASLVLMVDLYLEEVEEVEGVQLWR
jgi:hypothetical protein